MEKIRIIFVCLGNYCRSPMAEAIFNKLAALEGRSDYFLVTSAGTKDWDIGLHPDPRTMMLLKEHHYPLSPNKRAQMITIDEVKAADYVIAMDQRVADELGNGDNVYLLLDFVDGVPFKDISDPYPTNTFEEAFTSIELGVNAFYAHLHRTVLPTD
jgi:protein-tyrosine phosphatase